MGNESRNNAILSRSEAVSCVRGCIGTPYRLGARLPGLGLDCCTLLVHYLISIGRMEPAAAERLPFYSADWFLHASSERYLKGLMRFGTMVSQGICLANAPAQPGDLALFKVVGSRLFNHGAVVTAWPLGVHAQANGVREVDLTACPLTAFRKMELYNPFEDPDGPVHVQIAGLD